MSTVIDSQFISSTQVQDQKRFAASTRSLKLGTLWTKSTREPRTRLLTVLVDEMTSLCQSMQQREAYDSSQQARHDGDDGVGGRGGGCTP